MRAVIIAENVGVFEEFAGRDAALKLGAIDEMVGFAVDLVAPRFARRVGDRKRKPSHFSEQAMHQGRFSRTRRSRNDENCGHSMGVTRYSATARGCVRF